MYFNGSGFCLLSMAILCALSAPKNYLNFLNVVGFFILVMTTIGAYGMFQEHIYFLISFSTFGIMVLILQVLGICYASEEDEVEKIAYNHVEDMWNTQLIVDGYMDEMQWNFHCCGKNGPHDYIEILREIPGSCQTGKGKSSHYETGCRKAVNETYRSYFKYLLLSEHLSLIANTIGWIVGTVILVVLLCRQYRRNAVEET
ncbi:23 kDa integral membrane protein-like isoform X2 [Teleopsis dalmanni]|uniref:23 kDa integral membrane protein-like isoform X2 n=1 Tax=Teleopsis dalmanni TaxID=139649 RepID=UPI0018CFBBDA|nr:23 kDa integral membrane protein-like isoform X2 [Teleopsis dalmanni]XP_037929386.1 23 kDa integral membrane protein-like isoform X2 [Teleopsis dalmanni]XP_037952348.1 23 kDa integral membrane protein-like isoform X2 [Teleopsis dalmanni]XP_037952349.1 23 kDa integral membrane protein-like isoform X2 [Teleopsis dalmanni]XP_037954379.1 23 kDa integral membrane protein-like isoform X2 [Teleopsis dalmanni]